MERRELQILEHFGASRTEPQDRRFNFLQGRHRTVQAQRQKEREGPENFLSKERKRARANDSEARVLQQRAKMVEVRKKQGVKQPGFTMVDTKQSAQVPYSNELQKVLKVILLVVFQCYPLTMKEGKQYVQRCITEHVLKQFLIAVLQVVALEYDPNTKIKWSRSPNDGRIKYRKVGFNQAFGEVLEDTGSNIWRVKQEFLGFVTQNTRKEWYMKKFRPDILSEVVRIAGDKGELSGILQKFRDFENQNQL